MTEEYLKGIHPSHTSPAHQDQGDHALHIARHGEGPADTATSAASAERPTFVKALLNDVSVSRRGNAPVRQAAMLDMQRTHGNRAVQRTVSANGTAGRVAVQRTPSAGESMADMELQGGIDHSYLA